MKDEPTKIQREVLEELANLSKKEPDTFVFPGKRTGRTFESLEHRGWVEGDLRLHTITPDSKLLKRAYKITDEGKEVLKQKKKKIGT